MSLFLQHFNQITHGHGISSYDVIRWHDLFTKTAGDVSLGVDVNADDGTPHQLDDINLRRNRNVEHFVRWTNLAEFWSQPLDNNV